MTNTEIAYILLAGMQFEGIYNGEIKNERRGL